MNKMTEHLALLLLFYSQTSAYVQSIAHSTPALFNALCGLLRRFYPQMAFCEINFTIPSSNISRLRMQSQICIFRASHSRYQQLARASLEQPQPLQTPQLSSLLDGKALDTP